MNKVYLVNNGGEYSDYAILAIFTDKANAEAFASLNGSIDTVEEWDCDIPSEKWKWYQAWLQGEYRDGKWEKRITCELANRPRHEAPEGYWNAGIYKVPWIQAIGHGLTEEEAIGAADAKFLEGIREKQLPTVPA